MADHGQPPAALVVEVHQRPGRVGGVRGLEHRIPRQPVVGIFGACLDVDRAQLPALERVGQAFGKALFLLLLVHGQPVLEKQHAIVGKHLLEHRRLLQEGLGLLRGAEPHDTLHPRPVVPAAVEQHDLATRRQILQVALEVPLALLAFGRFGQRHGAALAWVHALRESCDDAALAGRVAPLDDHHQALSGRQHPARYIVELDLQGLQFLQVHRLVEFLAIAAVSALGGFRALPYLVALLDFRFFHGAMVTMRDTNGNR